MSRNISILLIAAWALVASASISDNVKNSVYGSRGGDIMITHASPIMSDALVITFDHESRKAASNIPSRMAETEFASLVSHVLGGFSMSTDVPKQTEAFPSSSLFNKPRANLVLAIPSLGESSISQFSLSNIKKLRQDQSSFTLEAAFEPRNSLSQITTLMTGALPSTHGISGSQWATPENKGAAAFSTPGSHSASATVGDVLLRTFENSAVISFSSSPAHAAAGAAHVRSGFERSYIVSIQEDSIVNTGVGSGFSRATVDVPRFVSHSQLLSNFKSSGSIRFNKESNSVFVKTSIGEAEFNLSEETDASFLSELAALDELLGQLRTGELNQLVSNNAPELYSVTLVGLQNIASMYGDDVKVAVASKLVDAIVPEVVSQFQSLYNSQLSAEVVLMGSSSNVIDSTARKAIISSVQHMLNSNVDAEETFPSLYVKQNAKSSQIESLCQTAQETATKFGLNAECVSKLTRPVLLQQKSQLKEQTTTKPQDVVDFQIFLWVSVLLIVILFSAVYPLLYLDVTSGVFSSFLFAKKYV